MSTQVEYSSFVEGDVRDYFEKLILQALDARASDIHIEPINEHFRVRFRIDGILHHVEALQGAFYGALVSIIKLLSQLDIAQKRFPQDGRLKMELNKNIVELRVSILPSIYGESVVLRLLRSRKAYNSFSELGFIAKEEEKLRHALAAKSGLVVVTGPTGVGKTTTLYTILSHFDALENKIISIEDPIEVSLPGVNQVPVNTEIGLTFAAALRSILRQSPNIIMIGEIRDQETAEIALHAASTGHLVLTSVHANEATSAIVRLLDLGIPPYLLAEYLRCVVAQRLVRRYCKCLGRAASCLVCNGIGYYGRIGVYHVLPVISEIKNGILHKCSISELNGVLSDKGLGSLRGVGQVLVEEGITSVDEAKTTA